MFKSQIKGELTIVISEKNIKDKDDLKIKELEEKILPELQEIFNEHFQTNYTQRFWLIIY